MSDPYGPFHEWDAEATYSAGDRVSYGGYLYEAMTAISAGDNPRTATFTATAYNKIGTDTDTRTMRKWRIWDYPADYIMARLRGIGYVDIGRPSEVKTICVRGEYNNLADGYIFPTYVSYEFYGMTAGLDTVWPDPEYGELLIMTSAVPIQNVDGFDTVPKGYVFPGLATTGLCVCFQPNTVSAEISTVETSPGSGVFVQALSPAWSTETQGQMIACSATFSRDYKYNINSDPTIEATLSTPSFDDNWTDSPTQTGTNDFRTIIDSSPDFMTDDVI